MKPFFQCSSTDTMTDANNSKILKIQLSKKSAKHVSYNECSFKKCCCRKSVINLDNQPLSESQMKTIGTVHQARYSRCVQIKSNPVQFLVWFGSSGGTSLAYLETTA